MHSNSNSGQLLLCAMLLVGVLFSSAHAFGFFGFDHGLSDPFGTAFHHPAAAYGGPRFPHLSGFPQFQQQPRRPAIPSACEAYASPLQDTDFFSVDTAEGRREIYADLPGISRRDVSVSKDRDGHLRIRAVRSVDYACRPYVSLSPSHHQLARTLELPSSVSVSDIKADFSQGRLVVSFPLPDGEANKDSTQNEPTSSSRPQRAQADTGSSSASSASSPSSSSSSSHASRSSTTGPSPSSAPSSASASSSSKSEQQVAQNRPRWKFTPDELEALTATAERIAHAPIGIGTGTADADVEAAVSEARHDLDSDSEHGSNPNSDCFKCVDEDGTPRYYHIALSRDG